MKYSFLSLIIITLFFFGFGLHSPGVVFQVETTYHSGTPGSESVEMSVEGNLLKMEILPDANDKPKSAQKDEVIFRGDRKEMIVVDHDKKSYTVIDEKTINKLAGQLGAVQSQMDEMMKNLPDDVKKQLEEARKNGVNIPGMSAPPQMAAKTKVEVKNTGERGTKEGYPCVKYEIYINDSKTQELWVTDWDNITGGGEAKAAFGEMAKFFKEMLESMPNIGGDNSPFGNPDTNFAKTMSEIDGFPIVTRDFNDGGELESESVLRSATSRTLDPADFEPPSGYKRMSMGPQ